MKLSEAEQRALIETLCWSSSSQARSQALEKLARRGLIEAGDGEPFHQRRYTTNPHSRGLALELAVKLGETCAVVAGNHAKERSDKKLRGRCCCWACIARHEYLKAHPEEP